MASLDESVEVKDESVKDEPTEDQVKEEAYFGAPFIRAMYGSLYARKGKATLQRMGKKADIVIAWRENDSSPITHYFPALLQPLAQQFTLFSMLEESIMKGEKYPTLKYNEKALPVLIFDKLQTDPGVIPKLIEYSVTGELPKSAFEVISMGRAVGDADLESRGNELLKNIVELIVIRDIGNLKRGLFGGVELVAKNLYRRYNIFSHSMPGGSIKVKGIIDILNELIILTSDPSRSEITKIDMSLFYIVNEIAIKEKKPHINDGVRYASLLTYMYGISKTVDKVIRTLRSFLIISAINVGDREELMRDLRGKLKGRLEINREATELYSSGLIDEKEYKDRTTHTDDEEGIMYEACLEPHAESFKRGELIDTYKGTVNTLIGVMTPLLHKLEETLKRFNESIKSLRETLKHNGTPVLDDTIHLYSTYLFSETISCLSE